MFKKVLFATDLTAISASATPVAVEIASRFGAEVVLVHAIETVRSYDDNSSEYDALYERLKAKAAEKASGVVSRFTDAGVSARLVTEIGKRWEVICDVALAEQADLVVMGSQSIREGEKVYVGSTSHKVFLMAQVPVLVVKG